MSVSLNITATEDNIMNIFSSSLYIIPVYQRPYSWDISRCEQLWDDILDFIDLRNDLTAYFLGTVIVSTEEAVPLNIELIKNEAKLYVIDGQQRLTTLSILASALYKRDSRNENLRKSLYSIDSRESIKVSPRVISFVNNNSEALFFTKCFENTEYTKSFSDDVKSKFKNNNYKNNFDWFTEKVNKLTDEDVLKIADTILYNVTLLKVVVPKRSDALVIFKTINDRGMQLDEADILKAEIYSMANKKNEADKFIKKWEDLYERVSNLSEKIKDFDMPALFRHYMHVKRGINKDTSKEVSLLDFFKGKSINKNKYIPENDIANIPWHTTMEDLDKLCGVLEWLTDERTKGDIGLLYNALICYNNLYPFYSIIVYLFHQVVKNNDVWHLERSSYENFMDYFEKILAFAYSIVLLNPGVNAIKEAVFKVMVDVSEKGKKISISDYIEYKKKDFEQLKEYLEGDVGLKIARGYLVLLIYLNNKNNKSNKIEYIPNAKELNIEHILPKKWEDNFYDNWNIKKGEEVMNKLGNLILMDKVYNIKASNLWFSKKKEIYNLSDFKHGELIDLLSEYSNTWGYDQFLEREEKSVRTLLHFFKEAHK